MSYLSDDQLWQSNSPTQRQDQKNEIYFKLSCSATKQYEVFDTLEEAEETLKRWINESLTLSFEEQTTITLFKYVNEFEVFHKDFNTLEIAFNLSKLTIELYQIKSTQFELTSDQIVRINEIEKEIKEILNL